jgi:ACS family D-galactonate transporter-like MFS transporter
MSAPMAALSYPAVWALIVYTWISIYLARMALGPLLPLIMSELGLNYAQAGLLSTALFWGYIAMQFPAGLAGDRIGRKRMLIAGVLMSAACTGLTALAGSFWALFAARFLTGLGQGFLFSNDRVLIAATTPRDKMALGQGVSFSGPGLGTALGLFLAGALAVVIPWRGVFAVLAGPPVLAALLLWALAREPPRAAVAADPAWPFRRVLQSRDYWFLAGTGIMPVYTQFLLGTWAPLMFAEIGVDDVAQSAALSSLQGLVAPAGLLLSGLAADRIHRRGLGRKVVIAGALALTALSLLAMGAAVQGSGSAWLLTGLLLVSSFFFWGAWSPAWAILGELFPPSVLGKAFGLYNATCFIGGVSGPYLTGVIRDATGTFAVGLYAAAAGCLLCGALVMAVRPPWRLAPVPALVSPRAP